MNAIINKLDGGYKLKTEYSKEIEKILPNKERIVFILVDGMGLIQLQKLAKDSLLENNIKKSISTICPSSTGTVLTSIATNMYTCSHGINGWFSYYPAKNTSFIPLSFCERFSNEPIKDIPFTDVFFQKPTLANLNIDSCSVMPSEYVNSDFSKWSRGNKMGLGYKSISDAFNIAKKQLNVHKKSYIYIYFDVFDATCHLYGSTSQEAKNILGEINYWLEEFIKGLGNDVGVVITSDHGQIDVDIKNYSIINENNSLCEFFYAKPSGASRFTSFYIKEDKQSNFKEEFEKRYSDKAILLSLKEASDLNLFGKNKLSEKAEGMLGNYIALWKRGFAFDYIETYQKPKVKIGHHSGLTIEEMKIPLIIF